MKIVKKDFMKSIINNLDEVPRTALELSKLSDTSWEATNNLLIDLSYCNLIGISSKGKRYYYFSLKAKLRIELNNIVKTYTSE